MNAYKIINGCLVTLKSSDIDTITKLRMENLLIGIKMLLLVDLVEQRQSIADLERLAADVDEVCTGRSADGVARFVEHVRSMRTSISACLDLA